MDIDNDPVEGKHKDVNVAVLEKSKYILRTGKRTSTYLSYGNLLVCHHQGRKVNSQIPESTMDIELSQEKAKYFRVHAEETHYLAADPTTRNKAITKLYQNPEVKKGFLFAATFVGPEDDPRRLSQSR